MTTSDPERFLLSDRLQAQILRHAARSHPDECCGLIAGYPSVALEVYTCPNAADSPASAFSVDAGIHYALDRVIEQSGHQLAGIYHSHPRGQQELSAADIAAGGAHGPELVHVLAYRELAEDAIYSLRAFRIVDGRPVPAPIEG